MTSIMDLLLTHWMFTYTYALTPCSLDFFTVHQRVTARMRDVIRSASGQKFLFQARKLSANLCFVSMSTGVGSLDRRLRSFSSASPTGRKKRLRFRNNRPQFSKLPWIGFGPLDHFDHGLQLLMRNKRGCEPLRSLFAAVDEE